MSFNYITIILGFIIGFILFFKFPILKKQIKTEISDIKLSVIIPVRNEEDNLPNLLADLKNQTYDIHEIICVDDDSQDATSEVINNFGVKCVKLDSLPETWKGKPWACQNGSMAATGDVLIFLDADVRLSDTAVESLVFTYQRDKSPISVLPYHCVKKTHEYFSIFFNLVKICGTGMSVFGKKKNCGLYGPVFMVDASLFRDNGGFEAVKDSVVEDLNLGKCYASDNIDLELFFGGEEISFRMYPKSFKDVLEGWSKNFAKGAISIRWWILLLVFIWIASLNAVPLEMVRNILSGTYTPLIWLICIQIIFAYTLFFIVKRAGSYPLYVCILYPVYLIVFELIFVYSVFASFLTKKTTWKSRKL